MLHRRLAIDVCEGELFRRRAEIHITSNPRIYERIDEGKAVLDCGRPTTYGLGMIPPPQSK